MEVKEMPYIDTNLSTITTVLDAVLFSNVVNGIVRKTLALSGINNRELVLLHLIRHSVLGSNVIRTILGLTPPGSTAFLNRMERKGLIYRKRSENDRRVIEYGITEGGIRVYENSAHSSLFSK